MGDDSEKKKIDEEVPMIDVKDGKGAQLEGKRFFSLLRYDWQLAKKLVESEIIWIMKINLV